MDAPCAVTDSGRAIQQLVTQRVVTVVDDDVDPLRRSRRQKAISNPSPNNSSALPSNGAPKNAGPMPKTYASAAAAKHTVLVR